MLLSLMYLLVRTLLRLLVPPGHGEAAKDLEIVVLQHEVMCFGARSSGLTFDLPIGPFSPHQLAYCHGPAGSVSW